MISEIKIGVFDSGVGGISIGNTIYDNIPNVSVIYCCDNLHYPYGNKAPKYLLELTLKSIEVFLKTEKIDILVIACNTASTLILPELRQRYSVPIVGVVPAIKPASLLSKTKIIGLLATPATINRPYVDDLIIRFASDCQIIKIGSLILVELAEQKLRGEDISVMTIREEIKAFFQTKYNKKRLDTIILGCTHFTLLTEELQKASAWPVTFVDSSQAIVNRVKNIINNTLNIQILNLSVSQHRIKKIFFTKQDQFVKRLWDNYLIKNNFISYEILQL